MIKYEVGQVFENLKNREEGVRFDMSDAGAVLFISFYKPTLKEIEDIKTGNLQFGLFVKDGIIFVLSKFGSIPWMDSPYHVGLSTLINLDEIGEGKGYGCHITLVDGSTGEIKAMRYVSFNTQYSRKLKYYIEEQMNSNFDNGQYNAKLVDVILNYPTKDMVRLAMANCRIK